MTIACPTQTKIVGPPLGLPVLDRECSCLMPLYQCCLLLHAAARPVMLPVATQQVLLLPGTAPPPLSSSMSSSFFFVLPFLCFLLSFSILSPSLLIFSKSVVDNERGKIPFTFQCFIFRPLFFCFKTTAQDF